MTVTYLIRRVHDDNKDQTSCHVDAWGTSKGAYLLRKDMPPERKDWDSVLFETHGKP